jgi:hypothetical protein
MRGRPRSGTTGCIEFRWYSIPSAWRPPTECGLARNGSTGSLHGLINGEPRASIPDHNFKHRCIQRGHGTGRMSQTSRHPTELGKPGSSAPMLDKYAIVPISACVYALIVSPLLAHFLVQDLPPGTILETDWGLEFSGLQWR